MATRTFGASPGVVMSWSEMWTWKAETPASVPAGARISAGNTGSVARSLPNSALALVNRSPVSCMPSPESPANRMITRFSSCGVTRSTVSDTRTPLSVRRARRDVLLAMYRRHRRRVHTLRGRSAAGPRRGWTGLGDRHRTVEVDVLDGVEQLDTLAGRALERLATADQTGAPGSLVDHRGAHGVGQVAGALGLATGVDEPDATHVKVRHLPTGGVDGVVGGELVVDERRCRAETLRGVVAAVVGRQLLLDDVGLDGDAEVVGLGGEISRRVVVDAVDLEAVVAQVAPQHREHAELVGAVERLAHLDDLAVRLGRAEVDGGADAGRPQVEGLLDRPEHDLVIFVRVGQQLVVVHLDDERDLVAVAPCAQA